VFLQVETQADVDCYMALIKASATRAHDWIAGFTGDPLELLRELKYSPVGCHPIEDRPLNLVEQINQTWTYAVALEAARKLLELHPDAGGFRVAPGAHMSIPLDIMSVADGLVGAETFATVHPRNNGKLAADLAKLKGHPEIPYRYVFFASPAFPETARLTRFEQDGVQVWTVKV
jgi:hypothetical protein